MDRRYAPKFDKIQFRNPIYCDNFKFLLVEELVYVEHPVKLHYGKCSVIGRVIIENEKYYLQNITLKCLGRKSETGQTQVLLLPSIANRIDMLVGKVVEVTGETVLFDHSRPFETRESSLALNEHIKSPKDIMLHIGDLQMELECQLSIPKRPPSGMSDRSMNKTVRDALFRELIRLKEQYTPAIRVFHLKAVAQHQNLVASNLQLRLIRKK